MPQKPWFHSGNAVRRLLQGTNQFVKSIKRMKRAAEARAKRRSSTAKFIPVTGSSGKTTTVRLLAHILSADYRVESESEKNGMSDAVGLLRRLEARDQFVILEAGTTQPGEIESIAAVFKPDVVIVTLVALEHFSAFRTTAAVALEKSASVRALSARGLAILNGDSPEIRAMGNTTAADKKFLVNWVAIAKFATCPYGRTGISRLPSNIREAALGSNARLSASIIGSPPPLRSCAPSNSMWTRTE